MDGARHAGAARRHARRWSPAQFEFVHNVRVPGMLHGRVVRPPSPGATVVSVDESSVRDLPGLVKVVVKNNFVGVVAEKPWQAMQAADEAAGHVDAGRRAAAAARRLSADPDSSRPPTRCSWTRATSTRRSRRRPRCCSATYHHPYQMHGSIGSSCAVADVQADKATLWSATQSAYPDAQHHGAILGLQAGRRCA